MLFSANWWRSRSVKKRLILDAWNASNEDYARTAERLGIHVNSLHRMVKNLGIKDAFGC